MRGDVLGKLEFLDRRGRLLEDPGVPIGVACAVEPPPEQIEAEACDDGEPSEAPVAAAPPSAPALSIEVVPAEVDATWWRQRAHLLEWNERRRTFELAEGTPQHLAAQEVEVDARAACVAGVASARPAKLAEIIGQERAVASLSVACQAAVLRGDAVPHVLLTGPAGLGKTSLARAVAGELGVACVTVDAPVVREPGTLLTLLASLSERDVLFVDEIHRLPARVAESLYQAMEDGVVHLPLKVAGQQRTVTLQLPAFTMIGATSEPDLVLGPMRSRFGIREHLEFCSVEALCGMVGRLAVRLGIAVDGPATVLLSEMARGVPREALSLFLRARDVATVAGAESIDVATVERALESDGIDAEGLRSHERRYLEVLREAGRAMGLATLAGRLGESKAAVREYERDLLRLGFVRLTRHGRVAA